jgi:hypothetical protein
MGRWEGGRGGDEEVAGTIHLREERWEGGGGSEEVPSPPRSSGRVVKVEAMWPGRDEPFAFVWGGGKVVEVARRWPRPSPFEQEGGAGVSQSVADLNEKIYIL